MSRPLIIMDAIRLAGRRRPVLHEMSLSVDDGEWVTILGGSTTTDGNSGIAELAMVLAGFTRPDSGGIRLGEEDITRLAPHRRGIGVVHRDLGLFARMSVGRMMAASGALPADARMALSVMRLDELAALLPARLSPEQAVRVAIARAIARRPSLLLLDDPWAGLSVAEAEQVLTLLVSARAMLGFAVLHLTARKELAWHQPERLVALIDGRVRQDDTAARLYDAPADLDTALLLGPCNSLTGQVRRIDDDMALVQLDFGPPGFATIVEARGGPGLGLGACRVGVRPERLAVTTASVAELGEGAFAARIDAIQHHGDHVRLMLSVGAANGRRVGIMAARPAAVPPLGARVGAEVAVAWQPDHARAYPLARPGAGHFPMPSLPRGTGDTRSRAVAVVAPADVDGYREGAREDIRATSRTQDQPT